MDFKNLNKKSILIISIAATVTIVIIIAIIAAIGRGNKTNINSSDAIPVSENNQDTVESELPEDDRYDPENNDLTSENGANVSSDNLKRESGRSNGIDVSKWQGKIDWQQVKAAGIEFAFIRIGYRGENGTIYKDANADYNIQQAEQAGVLVGVYFFSTALNVTEAEEEARWTLSQIEGYGISYPVVYDCEGFQLETSRMHSVGAAERTANAIAFMNAVRAANYEPMLYGAKNELESSSYWEISKIENAYKIWVAQYPAITYPAAEYPDYTGRFDAWQYTNRGSLSGIAGNIDMVVCYFEREKAEAKNAAAAPNDAAAPLTEEEKKYIAADEIVTAKEATNLRSGASTKTDIIVTLYNGETVRRIGLGSNGWSKLDYNGLTVYAITSYLTTDLTAKPDSSETPSQAVGDVVSGNIFTAVVDSVTAKDYVNLRALPETDSEIVTGLSNGTFLSRVATSDRGWSRLIYEGRAVYARTYYLTTETVVNTETTEAKDDFDAADEQVTAKLETNLRTNPSTTDSEIVYTLKNGEFVHRIGMSSKGWSKLEYNGQIVYAITSYLTTEAAVATAE